MAVQVFAERTDRDDDPGVGVHARRRTSTRRSSLLEVRERPAVDVADMDAFFRFVEAVFQFRRKQLGGTLGRISGIGSTAAAARLRDCGHRSRAAPADAQPGRVGGGLSGSFAATGR